MWDTSRKLATEVSETRQYLMPLLLDAVRKVAAEVPETRRHLVPLLRKYSSACDQVTGGQRDQYEEAVWGMFVKTYQSIGLILSNSQEMYEYQVWEICLVGGRPVAFNLFKKTRYGLKSGLSGSDGSLEGKRFILDMLRTKYKQPGYYGEVSHKVEEIALAAGSPVVCNIYVPEILGKPVTLESDGLHYARNLSGVGKVTKILVGRPKGIPTTESRNPVCGVTANLSSFVAEDSDNEFDVRAHYACMSLPTD